MACSRCCGAISWLGPWLTQDCAAAPLEALEHLAKAGVQEVAGCLAPPVPQQAAEKPSEATARTAGRLAGGGGRGCSFAGTTQHLGDLVPVLVPGRGEESEQRR